jgi:8-oxo-dGTP diphosphatase
MMHPRRHVANDMPDLSPGSSLRVCVALLRWNGTELETATMAFRYLPSAQPAADETLDQTAIRVIREATGVDAQYLEQLYTFSPSVGGPRQIVISYLALFSPETATPNPADGLVWSLAESTTLADDLDQMVLEYALVRLRAKLGYTTIAFYLLPATFTLSELQQTYESILNQAMDKRNFRRRMIASEILIDTGEKRREGSHRPAALYRFREQSDQESYLTPPLLKN